MTISTIMAEIPYLSFEWKILIWIGRFCSVSCFRIDNQFEIRVELQKGFFSPCMKKLIFLKKTGYIKAIMKLSVTFSIDTSGLWAISIQELSEPQELLS